MGSQCTACELFVGRTQISSWKWVLALFWSTQCCMSVCPSLSCCMNQSLALPMCLELSDWWHLVQSAWLSAWVHQTERMEWSGCCRSVYFVLQRDLAHTSELPICSYQDCRREWELHCTHTLLWQTCRMLRKLHHGFLLHAETPFSILKHRKAER